MNRDGLLRFSIVTCLVLVQAMICCLQAQDAQSVWRYAPWGTRVGRMGIAIGGTSARPVVYTGGTWFENTFLNDHWQGIQYNPELQTYETVYVSALHPELLESLVGNVAGDDQAEVVLRDSSKLYVYSQPSMALLSEFEPFHLGFRLVSVFLRDIDGDGVSEIVVGFENGDTLIYRGNGEVRPWPDKVWRIVGQFDSDPALEYLDDEVRIVDSETGQVQWELGLYPDNRFQVVDVNGDGVSELIHTAFNVVTCYDTQAKAVRWTYTVTGSFAISDPVFADLDADGRPEALCIDRGSIQIVNGENGTLIKTHITGGYEVASLKVADLDGDGQKELVWADSAEFASFTGSHLRIADALSGQEEWRSVDLQLPFTQPCLGDLDGDSRPELVFGSWQSDSNSKGGRLLVFDAQTLRLKTLSAPIDDVILDVKLRDINRDGKMEVLVASADYDRGFISILTMAAGGALETLRRFFDPTVAYEPFSQVDAADVDADGQIEVLGCSMLGNSAALGVRLSVFNQATGAVKWKTSHMRSAETVAYLRTADFDGDGGAEVLSLLSSGDVFIYDARSRQLETVVYGYFTAMDAAPDGLTVMLGDVDGGVSRLSYAQGQYSLTPQFSTGSERVNGVTYDQEGHLWVGAGSSLSLWKAPFGQPVWKSADGYEGVATVAMQPVQGGVRVFSTTLTAVECFLYVPPANAPSILQSSAPLFGSPTFLSGLNLEWVRGVTIDGNAVSFQTLSPSLLMVRPRAEPGSTVRVETAAGEAEALINRPRDRRADHPVRGRSKPEPLRLHR